MGTASAQASRRLARTRETVTIRTQTRDTTVDPSTGDHTFTDTKVAQQIPAIVYDQTNTNARNPDQERDINVHELVMKVEASTTVELGDLVEIVDSNDPQMVGITGTVTTVGRSGRMFRQLTVTTTRTP